MAQEETRSAEPSRHHCSWMSRLVGHIRITDAIPRYQSKVGTTFLLPCARDELYLASRGWKRDDGRFRGLASIMNAVAFTMNASLWSQRPGKRSMRRHSVPGKANDCCSNHVRRDMFSALDSDMTEIAETVSRV